MIEYLTTDPPPAVEISRVVLERLTVELSADQSR
jgi:hypothetical protein